MDVEQNSVQGELIDLNIGGDTWEIVNNTQHKFPQCLTTDAAFFSYH